MKQTISVWDFDTLAAMFSHVSDSHAEWSIFNELTGDQLTLTPDDPHVGMATLTLWERE